MRLACLTIAVMLLAIPAASQPDVDSMMLTRRLVANIFFPEGSAALDEASQIELAQAVESLMRTSADARLLRLEGFASQNGDLAANLALSFARAKSVQHYLQTKFDLPVEIFLTGFGEDGQEGSSSSPRRVDLSLYEDRIGILTAPVEQTFTHVDEIPSR